MVCVHSFPGHSQSLQWHYDLRHTIDPDHNTRNFQTLFFQYFKTLDSGSYFIKPGSFLLQMQSDFDGDNHNMGKFYMQVSQSLRCWKPKIYLSLEYSGGLGIAEPGSYGFYIANGFSLGASHLMAWKGGYYNLALSYRYNAFKRPSHDAMFSFYWWKGFWNYRIEISGDLEAWTQNKNHGDASTAGRRGKSLAMFGEPQVWLNGIKKISIGTKVNLYYNVLTPENLFQVYPTLGLRYKL